MTGILIREICTQRHQGCVHRKKTMWGLQEKQPSASQGEGTQREPACWYLHPGLVASRDSETKTSVVQASCGAVCGSPSRIHLPCSTYPQGVHVWLILSFFQVLNEYNKELKFYHSTRIKTLPIKNNTKWQSNGERIVFQQIGVGSTGQTQTHTKESRYRPYALFWS